MSSFARAKASLSILHILEVPLYTFLQKKCVQHSRLLSCTLQPA